MMIWKSCEGAKSAGLDKADGWWFEMADLTL